MNTLKMNSDDLKDLGNKIIQNSYTFESLISAYTNTCESLTAPGTWDGTSSDQFNQVAANFKMDLEKAANIVREVGEDLVRTANLYDETQSNISSNIGSML